jgi:hypothetical protein
MVSIENRLLNNELSQTLLEFLDNHVGTFYSAARIKKKGIKQGYMMHYHNVSILSKLFPIVVSVIMTIDDWD